jgi:hypothetical protein
MLKNMTRSDWVWFAAIALIAIALNPALKAIGLLPADVLRHYGVFFPGLPQIVFGPLLALLSLVCFIKTRDPLVFPVIGILRALSLGFVFPANLEHLGTSLAGILVGFIAVAMLRDAGRVRLGTWLPVLSGLYAGFYAGGNYLTTLMFGPEGQTQLILLSSHVTLSIVLGSFIVGALFGALAYGALKVMTKFWPSQTSGLLQPRQA